MSNLFELPGASPKTRRKEKLSPMTEDLRALLRHVAKELIRRELVYLNSSRRIVINSDFDTNLDVMTTVVKQGSIKLRDIWEIAQLHGGKAPYESLTEAARDVVFNHHSDDLRLAVRAYVSSRHIRLPIASSYRAIEAIEFEKRCLEFASKLTQEMAQEFVDIVNRASDTGKITKVLKLPLTK